MTGGQRDPLSAFLEATEATAQTVVRSLDATECYEAAIDMLSVAMGASTERIVLDVAGPLHLIWGSLTDAVDGPGAERPGAAEAAGREMRQAAGERLVSSRDPVARTNYLDRWVYRELGGEGPRTAAG